MLPKNAFYVLLVKILHFDNRRCDWLKGGLVGRDGDGIKKG